MSFVRRVFFKTLMKKVHSENCDKVVDDTQFDEDIEDIDLIDEFRIERKVVCKREDLNLKFKKLAKQEKKMNRLQNHLLEMDRELVELRRMLHRTDHQKNALEAEIECKKEELKDATCLVQMDIEVEVKKKEPMLFKKYNNIKTTADAKALMTIISNKQRSLQNLEMLTFKKYLNNQHELKSKDKCSKSGRGCSMLKTPPKKPRKMFLQPVGAPESSHPAASNFFGPHLPFGPHPLFRNMSGFDNSSGNIELQPQEELEDELDSIDIDGLDDIENQPLVSNV